MIAGQHMKRGRCRNGYVPKSYYGKLGSGALSRAPAPAQLEIAGTITHEAVGVAHRKAVHKRTHQRSWEDDFAFQVRARRLLPIARKFRFAECIGRKWEADFAYPQLQLLIEIDGGVWRRGGGAHSHPSNILRDMRKSNDATRLGYRMLRFTSDEVRNGYAIDYLMTVLQEWEPLT